MVEVGIRGSVFIDVERVGDTDEIQERLRQILEGAAWGDDGVIDAIDVDVRVVGEAT